MKVFLETVSTDTRQTVIKQADISKTADLSKVQSDLEGITIAKSYVLRKHICGHDEGKACTEEIIKVVVDGKDTTIYRG